MSKNQRNRSICCFLSAAVAFVLLLALLPKEQAPDAVKAETPPAQINSAGATERPTNIESAPVVAPWRENFIRYDIPLDKELQTLLHDACEEFSLPYDIALAVIWEETRFRNVIGDGGNAAGYFQIWEMWHGSTMESIGATNLMDPKDNFRTGCRLLSGYIAQANTLADALTQYNSGSTGQSAYAEHVQEKLNLLRAGTVEVDE